MNIDYLLVGYWLHCVWLQANHWICLWHPISTPLSCCEWEKTHCLHFTIHRRYPSVLWLCDVLWAMNFYDVIPVPATLLVLEWWTEAGCQENNSDNHYHYLMELLAVMDKTSLLCMPHIYGSQWMLVMVDMPDVFVVARLLFSGCNVHCFAQHVLNLDWCRLLTVEYILFYQRTYFICFMLLVKNVHRIVWTSIYHLLWHKQ